MEVIIRTREIDVDDELRELITRRMEFALDTFGDRVESVSVYLMDLNGPKGGVDKICQINARIAGVGDLAVLETGPAVAAALNRAARSLKYRVSEGVRRAVRPTAETIRTLPATA